MRRLPLALALAATATVLALLLSPRVPVDPERLMPQGDKVAHAGMFAALAFLWCRAGVPGWASWLAALALAIGTELAQWAFLPTRTGDPLDALADMIGATVAVAGWRWLRRRRAAMAAAAR